MPAVDSSTDQAYLDSSEMPKTVVYQLYRLDRWLGLASLTIIKLTVQLKQLLCACYSVNI